MAIVDHADRMDKEKKMRKELFLAVALIGVGVAFAAGNAAPKLKFPYAGDALNQPCGRTLLEWRCLEKRVDCRPVPMNRDWALDIFLIEPQPAGLLAKMNISKRHAKASPSTVQDGIYQAQCRLEKEILPEPPAGPGEIRVGDKPFAGLASTRIEFYVDGKLLKAKGLSKQQLAGR